MQKKSIIILIAIVILIVGVVLGILSYNYFKTPLEKTQENETQEAETPVSQQNETPTSTSQTNLTNTTSITKKTVGSSGGGGGSDGDGSGSTGGSCASCGEMQYCNADYQCISLEENSFFVSTIGNDNNPGTINAPFLTIQKARDAIRANGSDGFTVYIRGGTYYLNESLKFNESDSGSEGALNTYTSYPGEKVIISGGKVLDSVNYSWTQYNHNGNVIYKTNVGNLRFNSLFVDDNRAKRAREPDTGYYQTAGVELETNKTAFNFSGNDINGSWHNLRDIEIVSLRSYIQTRLKIDYTNGNKVYVSQTANNGFDWPSWIGINQKVYYIENVFEGLDEPGEWYLDNTTGDLYYYPLDEKNPALSEIIIPILGHDNSNGVANGQLVYLNGAQYLNINGITFAHTDWSTPVGYKGWANAWFLEISGEGNAKGVQPAIGFYKANHSEFTNNIVKHIGGNAVNIYSHYIQITGNSFNDIGANGIRAGTWEPGIWPGLDGLTGDNIITDNIVHDVGVVFEEAAGIFVLVNGNNTISHNLIYNVPNLGISVGWGWSYTETICKNNKIEKNEIYNFSQVLSDSGAIYLTSRQPGTEIIGNKIHNGDTSGIYLDEGTAHVSAKNNLIYNVGAELFFHLSSNNSAENNIFAQASWTHIEMSGGKNNNLSHNIIFSNKVNSLFRNFGLDVNYSDYNLIYNAVGWDSSYDLSHWNALGDFDSHSLEQDPLFVDYANNDFTLQPSSPAFALGFENFDLSDVGPRIEIIGGTSIQSQETELHTENFIGTMLNWFRGIITANTIKEITGYFLKIK